MRSLFILLSFLYISTATPVAGKLVKVNPLPKVNDGDDKYPTPPENVSRLRHK